MTFNIMQKVVPDLLFLLGNGPCASATQRMLVDDEVKMHLKQ